MGDGSDLLLERRALLGAMGLRAPPVPEDVGARRAVLRSCCDVSGTVRVRPPWVSASASWVLAA